MLQEVPLNTHEGEERREAVNKILRDKSELLFVFTFLLLLLCDLSGYLEVLRNCFHAPPIIALMNLFVNTTLSLF